LLGKRERRGSPNLEKKRGSLFLAIAGGVLLRSPLALPHCQGRICRWVENKATLGRPHRSNSPGEFITFKDRRCMLVPTVVSGAAFQARHV
jgi:hypothetical protein